MPKFVVLDTIACWVEFKHEVEAENAEDARRKYNDGEADFIASEIGDTVDWVENYISVMWKEET